ncbi:hypothetical protein [Actinopolymorpha pittospori]|uniref:Uncharacterized protein n=1 Tax=Actinopolymorpha pittospori TaxID=648752 RepID=A0A927MV71_9ACTN|nr:hypothetical protein [Actinopolymorpha pittospori]MBE1603910.1 hypothetical protein [Actinopolymorpha pittospori]
MSTSGRPDRRRAIRAGELDKVIRSRIVPVREEIDMATTYLAGRRANDPARSFLLLTAQQRTRSSIARHLHPVDLPGVDRLIARIRHEHP